MKYISTKKYEVKRKVVIKIVPWIFCNNFLFGNCFYLSFLPYSLNTVKKTSATLCFYFSGFLLVLDIWCVCILVKCLQFSASCFLPSVSATLSFSFLSTSVHLFMCSYVFLEVSCKIITTLDLPTYYLHYFTHDS